MARFRVHRWAAVCVLAITISPFATAEQWVVTNRTEWESLVGGNFSEEDFADFTLQPGLSVQSDFGAVVPGKWQDSVGVSGSLSHETRFSFDQPVNSFGANWDMGTGGSGIHLLLDDTELVVPRVPDGFNGEFFGFVSNTTFSSITFLSRLPGQGDGVESYSMDNLVYSQAFNGTITQPDPMTLHTTSHSLATTLTIEIFLGDPNAGGQLLKSTGPSPLTGTVDAVIDLDDNGNGTVQLLGTDLDLADFGPSVIDGGALGTIDASLSGIRLSLESVRLDVQNFAFSTANTTPVVLEIKEGVAALTNPTGILATLLPDGYELDFNIDPLVVSIDGSERSFSGSVDLGSGLFIDGAELNAEVPTFVYRLFNLGSGVNVYARFSSSLHVATVPEASSFVFCGAAIGGLIIGCRKRLLR